MEIETLVDYVEWLADRMGIYGGCTAYDEKGEATEDDKCFGCRICWSDEMEIRIRSAVKNQDALQKAGL